MYLKNNNMGKKLTAIEWLLEVLNDQQLLKNYPIKMIDLAYEMEKQQIIDAYEQGYSDSDNRIKSNDNYYNVTFKTK
jgi:hypothetical protein